MRLGPIRRRFFRLVIKWRSYGQKNATAQDEQRRASRCRLTHLSSNTLSHPSEDPVTLPSAASPVAGRRFVERVGAVGLMDVGEMVRQYAPRCPVRSTTVGFLEMRDDHPAR